MTKEQAVKEKIARQQVTGTTAPSGVISETITSTYDKVKDVNEKVSELYQRKLDDDYFNAAIGSHKFKQTFYFQDNYEWGRFLWYNYKKFIGRTAISIGLCEVCGKLEIEHYE